MAFSQSDRVWWDTSQPGASTSELEDATPTAGTPEADEDSGTTGERKGVRVVCARSGFSVPESETVIDPISGQRVWSSFVDKVHPLDEVK